MINNNTKLTSLDVLAQIDKALIDSDINNRQTIKQPLPLYKKLVWEWLNEQDTAPHTPDDEFTLRHFQPLLNTDLAENRHQQLNQIFLEALQLSSIHGTLNLEIRRQMEQLHQHWHTLLDQAED